MTLAFQWHFLPLALAFLIALVAFVNLGNSYSTEGYASWNALGFAVLLLLITIVMGLMGN